MFLFKGPLLQLFENHRYFGSSHMINTLTFRKWSTWTHPLKFRRNETCLFFLNSVFHMFLFRPYEIVIFVDKSVWQLAVSYGLTRPCTRTFPPPFPANKFVSLVGFGKFHVLGHLRLFYEWVAARLSLKLCKNGGKRYKTFVWHNLEKFILGPE